jgi:hypothetical protein
MVGVATVLHNPPCAVSISGVDGRSPNSPFWAPTAVQELAKHESPLRLSPSNLGVVAVVHLDPSHDPTNP